MKKDCSIKDKKQTYNQTYNIGDKIKFKISDFSFGDKLISKKDNYVFMLDGDGVVGDFVEAEVSKIRKNFIQAEITNVINPSEHRKIPECSHFLRCGSCNYLNVNYDFQLSGKKTVLAEIIKRIAKQETLIKNIIPSKLEYHYRNKIIEFCEIRKNKLVSGFYKRYSKYIVRTKECYLEPEICKKISNDALSILNSEKYSKLACKKDFIRNIVIKYSFTYNEIMLIFVLNGSRTKTKKIKALFSEFAQDIMKQHQEIVSIYYLDNREKTNVVMTGKLVKISGKKYIAEKLNFDGTELTYLISPMSFFQINTSMITTLYGKVLEYLQPSSTEIIFDLYGGSGTISMLISDYCRKVFCIEIDKDSVETGYKNIKLNNKENVNFINKDSVKGMEELLSRGIKPDSVIIDPPRKGCTYELLQLISDMEISKIIYISCDASTLARDIKILAEKGYETQQIQGLDMFPQTYHLECIAKIVK